ncbi:MAG: S8 family serine peptidase [Betaproteobacteria bacterium]|nr:S8 family serine peptidase [Betaproteobacteria bacterium]
MKRRIACLRALLALALCALPQAGWADRGGAPANVDAPEREVLVMLRVPPPHYRPDGAYFGGYGMSLGHDARRRVADELAGRFKLQVVDRWPMPALGVDCFVMAAPRSAALGNLVDEIGKDPRVESVQRMNLFHALSGGDPLYPLQPTAKAWHLRELHRVATGKHVRVAEIDSGVELDHPDLRGRIMIARNFVDARAAIAETHGTAVAGIIAARANDGVGIAGVAPDAELMALRACWQLPSDENSAVCSSFTLAKALQFALGNDARVINLSLGGPPDRLLGRLLNVAESRGIVIVAAADPAIADGGFPASFPGVVAVAPDDEHDLGASVVLAPGRDVPATLPGKRWGLVSGSSFAAAEVAGLVALLLDIAPDQDPQRIREDLNASETTAPKRRRDATIDACAALAKAGAACTCDCSPARRGTVPPSP